MNKESKMTEEKEISKEEQEKNREIQYQRLKKAQIRIQGESPFFSYLSLYLKIKKEDNLPEYAGMGVSADGSLYFSPSFCAEQTDKQLIGCLSHEILHLAFLHLLRAGNRNHTRWNVACDIAVNYILKSNDFELPENGIIPNNYNTITILGKEILDINLKTAEQIYSELPEIKSRGKNGGSNGNSKDDDVANGWDEHKENTNQTEEEKAKEENVWLNRLDEAVAYSKQRGNVPAGMERFISNLHQAKVNWKILLRKYITNGFPKDFTYTRRNKKSIASGFYIPDMIKEKINVIVGIDTSGSIGDKEISDFLSEIIGIAKCYSNNLNMRIITCDTQIHEDLEVKNNVNDILKIKCKGGGGTQLTPIFDYINQKNYKPNVAVILTDGYCERMEKTRFQTIYVLSKNGTDTEVKDAGIVVRLEDDL